MSNPADLDPQKVTVELQGASRRLAKSANELAEAMREFDGGMHNGEFEAGAGRRFEQLVEARVAVIYTHTPDGKRPPPEDVRRALADQEIRAADPGLAAEYDRLSTRIAALKLYISAQKQVISGHQSVLSASKVLSGLGH